MRSVVVLLVTVAAATCGWGGDSAASRLELPPGPDNPRNSEGAFARLNDGRILFAYSHYTGTNSADHGTAHIASRFSADEGLSWSSEDKVEVPFDGRGQNIMSVSFLRLKSGALAMFYMRKMSQEDCRPVMCVSKDEAASWGPERLCVVDEHTSYYVLNNDRALRLKSGRIVLPMARHASKGVGRGWDVAGEVVCAYSDDDGGSWRMGQAVRAFAPDGRRIWAQEPGAVELSDGRLLVWARTNDGCQYRAFSADGGATFGPLEPWNLVSPVSPASVKRLSDGRLVAIWNDHGRHPEYKKDGPGVPKEVQAASAWGNGHRAPLTFAISTDDGASWHDHRDIETDASGWYCYTALFETESHLLLGYCARSGLKHSRIATIVVGSRD